MDKLELARLYEKHRWHVVRRGLRILGTPEEAEDVCQEVFIQLMAAWSRIRDRDRLTVWLFRATTHVCIDRLRGRKNQGPEALAGLAAEGEPESELHFRRLALTALGLGSREVQTLALLRYVDRCSLEEIERVSGLSRRTIQKRLDRFQARAKAVLGREGQGRSSE